MRRIALILLTACLMTACSHSKWEEGNGEYDGPTLGLAIEFPKTESSKSEVGELPAENLENALHSLSLWVFRSDDHSLITHRVLTEDEFPAGGGMRRYSLPVSREFANQRPDVDVFVLANAESITSSLNDDSTWDDLNDAYFSDSSTSPYFGFGVAHPVHEVDDEIGLPMSVVGKNMPIFGEAPILRVETVRLQRAVSRMRYVFCKTSTVDSEEEVSIQRVILNGAQIPVKEYVFTSSKTGIVFDQEEMEDNYVSNSYIVPGPSQLASNDSPESLIYINQDPVTYRRLLDEAVSAGRLTDLGYTYFRESDRRLVGRIEYTVDGKSRVREFNMASSGDFARNHTWTLFGYFLSGRNLQLALSVLPWDYNRFIVDFSEESINVSSPFDVDATTVELIETSKDHFDAHLLPGVAAKAHLYITTPVGGRLMIRPVGDARAFKVTPDIALIDPTTAAGRIDIEIRRNPEIDEDLTGSYITLSFSVETGERVIDANSEVVDEVYRFVI